MFTDGSYLKGDNGRYCAGDVTATSFDVVEAASLPTATLAQQAEWYALTQACTLAKDRTANIYIDSRYVLGVARDFGMLWKQCGFLISSRNKIKNGPRVQELLDATLLSTLELLVRFQGILNWTLWKLR